MKKAIVILTVLVILLSFFTVNLIKRNWRLLTSQTLQPVNFTGYQSIGEKEDAFEIESLAGLEAVYICEVNVGGRTDEPVVTEEQLKGYLESKLREGGMKILTKKESMATIDKAFLKLRLTGLQRYRKDRPIDYSYHLILRFGQSVRPARFVTRDELGDLEFDVVTWVCKQKGKCNRDSATESVQGSTQELVGKFLSDHLAANLKIK